MKVTASHTGVNRNYLRLWFLRRDIQFKILPWFSPLKAQRILDQGFKILSQRGLITYHLSCSLRASEHIAIPKTLAGRSTINTEHEIHITKQTQCFKLIQLSGSVHSQWRKAGTSVLAQEAWDTAGNSSFLFSHCEDPSHPVLTCRTVKDTSEVGLGESHWKTLAQNHPEWVVALPN